MLLNKGRRGFFQRMLMKMRLVKGASPKEILHFNDNLMNSMKKDLEKFGIYMSKPIKLTYLYPTEPYWLELFLDNNSLKRHIDVLLNIVKLDQDNLPSVIQLEKEQALVLKSPLVKGFLECDMESLQIVESILNKFEDEKYLSKNKITKYRNKILEFKDRIKLITIEQNLRG